MRNNKNPTTGITRPGLRNLRSVAGMLLECSRNITRAASRTGSAGYPTPLDDQLDRGKTIQRICREKSVDLTKQVTDLTKSLKEGFARKPEVVEKLNILRDVLTSIAKIPPQRRSNLHRNP